MRTLPDRQSALCPCAGNTLDKLVQPAILAALAREDAHGYILVQRLAAMPLFHGEKPDATGVYRFLRLLESRALVTSSWDTSETGPAKRLYHLTDAGRACLARWVDTLAAYRDAIGNLLDTARTATGGA